MITTTVTEMYIDCDGEMWRVGSDGAVFFFRDFRWLPSSVVTPYDVRMGARVMRCEWFALCKNNAADFRMLGGTGRRIPACSDCQNANL